MIIQGFVRGVRNNVLTVSAYIDKPYIIDKQRIGKCELRLDDGRHISADQRRKAYATLADIADWNGDVVEDIKSHMKALFIARTGTDWFSLSDCSVTTAREFISFLLDFCLEQDIPLSDAAINRAEDIGRYLYACIIHRKCAVCGRHADIHHTDGSRVGMGQGRRHVCHVGREAVALCRVHHNEAHTIGEQALFEKYKIFGVKLDEYAVKKLGLAKKPQKQTELLMR